MKIAIPREARQSEYSHDDFYVGENPGRVKNCTLRVGWRKNDRNYPNKSMSLRDFAIAFQVRAQLAVGLEEGLVGAGGERGETVKVHAKSPRLSVRSRTSGFLGR